MVEPIHFGIILLIFGVVPRFKMGVDDLSAGLQRAGWFLFNIFLFMENLYPFFIPQNITDRRLLVENKIPTQRMHHGGANFCTGEVVQVPLSKV